MPNLTTLQYAECYLGLSYLVGSVWFLLLSAKDGLLKWRLIATALAPVATPLLLLAAVAVFVMDKVFAPKMPKVADKKEAE